jgi:hypothetical protein
MYDLATLVPSLFFVAAYEDERRPCSNPVSILMNFPPLNTKCLIVQALPFASSARKLNLGENNIE